MIMDENESSWNLNDVAIGLSEMMHSTCHEEDDGGTEIDAAEVARSGRQVLSKASSLIRITSSTAGTLDPATCHIKVYSFYEIDSTKLPVDAPRHLKSIRIVMVTEKSNTGVVIRFPSRNSLRLHLSEGECSQRQGVKRVPSLDEKYFLETEVAGEVLYRRVSGDEIGENKNLWSFWVVSSDSCDVENEGDEEERGVGLSEVLESGGMMKWGKRKRVQYLKNNGALIRYDVVINKENEELVKCKRKRHDVNELSKKIKKKKKFAKDSNSRWPKERYTLAEVNMWKVLKKKNAVCGNPVLRPELRAEARKVIGDTGLLDHLLKHMAGKVAPGGQDRFRRRHNADGAMEYWLESADLVNIRKQAGVQDPYWTPPIGWKPGDNPDQDPVCAKEFQKLKDDLSILRMEMRDLLSERQEDSLSIVATQSQYDEQNSFLLQLKEVYADLMNKKAKVEEQMMEISQYLCRIEEELEKAKSAVGELIKPAESALTSEQNQGFYDKTMTTVPHETTEVPLEDRASKIKRLKSGFTLCKPLGSFLWPSMAMSPQPNKVAVHLEDLFLVPTPPSVSSSTASSSPQHRLSPLSNFEPLPNFPIKPLPGRGPVTALLTAAVNKATHPLPPETINQSETFTRAASTNTVTRITKTQIIDLNEIPSPNTYIRRNPNKLSAADKDAEISPRNEDERKETFWDQKQKESSSSASSSTGLVRISGT